MEAKWRVFVRSFIEYGGAETVLTGLKNTVLIAVFGLLIGIYRHNHRRNQGYAP